MASDTKRCPLCGEQKPRAQCFSTCGRLPSGTPKWHAYCKVCFAAYKRARYAKDSTPARRSVREWQHRNPERTRAYKQRSREQHREQYLAYQRAYYQTHTKEKRRQQRQEQEQEQEQEQP